MSTAPTTTQGPPGAKDELEDKRKLVTDVPTVRSSKKSLPYVEAPVKLSISSTTGKTGERQSAGSEDGVLLQGRKPPFYTKSSSVTVQRQRPRANACNQMCLLFALIWKLKKRQGKFAFFCEVIFPLVVLAIITAAWATFNRLLNPNDSPTKGSHQRQTANSSQLDPGLDRVIGKVGTINYPAEKPTRPDAEFKRLDDLIYSFGIQANEQYIEQDLSHGWIHVAPSSPFAKNEFSHLMSFIWNNNVGPSGRKLSFKYHSSERQLVNEFDRHSSKPLLGLVLPANFMPGDRFNYKIVTSKAIPTPPTSVTRGYCRIDSTRISACPARAYAKSNFLALQSIVEQSVAKYRFLSTSNDSHVELDIAMHTVNSYQSSKKSSQRSLNDTETEPTFNEKVTVAGFIWTFVQPTIIAMTGLLNSLAIFLVGEKRDKIKEGLRMMGTSNIAYWASWICVYALLVIVFWLAYTFSTAYVILYRASGVLFGVLYALYALSILALAVLLSTLFQKPKTAAVAITWFIRFTVLVCPFVMYFGYVPQLLPLNFVCIYAFMVGAREITKQHFYNILSNPESSVIGYLTPHVEVVHYACIFLAVDILLYILLALYLDNVIPGEYGARYPQFFCLYPSYWRKPRRKQTDGPPVAAVAGTAEDMEPVSSQMKGKEAIRIRDVHKTFPAVFNQSSVTALKGVSLDIYEGEITAILGRNGAGKTTLLSILLGLTPPSKGKAIVYGYDTSRPSDMNEIRKLVGPCLQHDLHYSDLTVDEHLMFFGRIRGLGQAQVASFLDELLAKLSLEKVRKTHAKDLSGGQKRKLSVAIALLGDPPVVLLDEPTAGLDPLSRRNLWDVLRWRKQGKVILLTTHFMDEADILADRKAIIHGGVIRCVGSSLFLKNRFGVGYHLVVELDAKDRDTRKVDDMIRKVAPEALTTKKVVASTVGYSLPMSETSNFPTLLSDMEKQIKDGGPIVGIGIELTTLEEVFLRIAFTSGLESRDHTEECNLLEKDVRLQSQKVAMILMLTKIRLLRLMRSPAYVFLMFVVPVILSLLAFSFAADLRPSVTVAAGIDMRMDQSSPKVAVQESSTLSKGFQSFLNNQNVKSESFSSGIKQFWKTKEGRANILGAISIEQDRASSKERFVKATISANGAYLHSQPMLLDLISEYFQRLSGSTERTEVTALQYEPRGGRAVGEAVKVLLQNAAVYFLCGTAISFASSALIIELVRDKELKTRNHLRLNGVSSWLYYLSMFITFGIVMLLLVLLILIIIGAFADGVLLNAYAMTWIASLLILNVFPQIAFAAVFSNIFSSSTSAEVTYVLVVILLGIITIAVMMAVDIAAAFYPNLSVVLTLEFSNAVHIMFSLFDVFYVPGIVLYWVLREHQLQVATSGVLPPTSFQFYNTKQMNTMLLCTLAQIPLLLLLLCGIDRVTQSGTRKLQCLRKREIVSWAPTRRSGREAPPDEDVEEEKRRVSNYFYSASYDPTVVIAVKDLRKNYPTQTVLHGISYMVSEGEVLGLLGHNGAGKTTSIRIMTGEELPDSGNVKICGFELNSSQSEAFKDLGFCPQHDALWDNVTLNEHMQLYAVLHGVSTDDSNRLISNVLKGLSIEEHRTKYSQKLSGGTKRKLCYAMSIIGYPRIVIMDEPSTGMDPHSKRYLWNTVLGTFKDSRGAIMTTHSMEEADVLCTRIAIMVQGRIVAVGTPHSLKCKFGSGYTLEIKLKPKDDEEVGEKDVVEKSSKRKTEKSTSQTVKKKESPSVDFSFITESFPGSKLLEAFSNRAVFSVPISGVQSISQAFSTLEKLKECEEIEEYAFSQTTLEQAYLAICRGAEEDE